MLSAIGLAGCGDAVLCDSSPLVVIQAPASAITIDGDSAAAGVQTDVRVRSTLLPTDEIELTLLDGAGAEVTTLRQPAGDGGTTVFAGVTVPGPRATLRATARTACGLAEDEIAVDVIAGAGCELQLTPAPQMMATYPIGVLNAALDPDPAPGFQAQLAVATRPGFLVEIYANMGQGEQLVAQGLGDAMGIVRSPQTLIDGPASLRAVCRGGRGEVLPSAAISVQVDATPPSCDFRSPAPGSSITPDLDLDGDLANGVQLAVQAYVVGGDAVGQPVQLTITSLQGTAVVAMTPVDAQGLSTATATLAPPPSPMMPSPFELELATQDRAGNPCVTTRPYEAVSDGCPIQVLGPTAPVTADADGDAANGSQVDVQLAVAPLCAGRTVTSTCGLNSPQGVVPPSGPLTLRVDLCGGSPCEASAACTFRVSTPAGVQTQASATIAFDDKGPIVGVQVVQPQLACGGQITPADDADAATAGVQLVARVTAPGGVSPSLELVNTGGTASFPATGDVTVTVAPGLNLLTGVALDPVGNRGQSAACTVALADMAVAVAPPAADGFVGRADGTVSGSALAFRLSGTVDRTGAAVTVRVDGGAAAPATVSGTTWFVDLSLAEAPHAVVVTATKGTSFGRATLPLAVDLTPPPAVGALAGTAPTRQRVGLAWTAPDDGGGPAAAYVVKWSTAALTDAGFDAQGTAIPTGAPRAPGSPEAAELSPARTGTPYWLGVAPVDRAGNRGPAAIAGPITPAFDPLGPFVSAQAGEGQLSLGAAIAHGRLNDDELDDLAVAAPTQSPGGLAQAGVVYVYFGRPTGIAATPDLVIRGGAAGALAGAGLATVRWQSATRDDLVIGAPGADGGAGRLFVFAGGAGFPTGTIAAAGAALQIGVSATAPGWFAGGGLGAAAAAADVDGDGVRDLVASAIRGGGGRGGIVIFYGGTVTGSLALSDTDPSGLGAAVVQYMPDPLALTGRKLGAYLHAVEPTGGPLDGDDDLVVGYEDGSSTTDSVYVLRGNGTRPAPGVSLRPFTPGRDVRIDLVTPYASTEFGAQAVAIADHNGDGAADLAISAYKDRNGGGQVYVIDGDTVGTGGVARMSDPGVLLTAIQGASGTRLGAVLVAHDELSDDDVDGDGRRDLMVGGAEGGTAAYLYVWFGGTLPRGVTTVATAGTKIAGPPTFRLSAARPQGAAGQGRWVGDLNGDGLDDVCWASPYDNTTMLDGSFAVLLDGVGP